MAILGHLRCFVADLILSRFLFFCVNLLGQKLWLRKFVDKYHVCSQFRRRWGLELLELSQRRSPCWRADMVFVRVVRNQIWVPNLVWIKPNF